MSSGPRPAGSVVKPGPREVTQEKREIHPVSWSTGSQEKRKDRKPPQVRLGSQAELGLRRL